MLSGVVMALKWYNCFRIVRAFAFMCGAVMGQSDGQACRYAVHECTASKHVDSILADAVSVRPAASPGLEHLPDMLRH